MQNSAVLWWNLEKNSTDFTEIPINLNVWQINFWIQEQIRIY